MMIVCTPNPFEQMPGRKVSGRVSSRAVWSSRDLVRLRRRRVCWPRQSLKVRDWLKAIHTCLSLFICVYISMYAYIQVRAGAVTARLLAREKAAGACFGRIARN